MRGITSLHITAYIRILFRSDITGAKNAIKKQGNDEFFQTKIDYKYRAKPS
jgi:hypothetical protein